VWEDRDGCKIEEILFGLVRSAYCGLFSIQKLLMTSVLGK
jgi:hypothetical protein